jgi:aspartate-semialdehyde dehydrogenase
MRNEGLLGNLLKIAGAGALLYGAYKLGEYHANQQLQGNVIPVINDEPKIETEEEKVLGLIQELKGKPNKTKTEKFNIELLEVKLKQIRNKK